MDSRKTPLHDTHKRLGARMVPFGGWSMPVEYGGIIQEHNAVRTAAGLFDVSHMGEFEVQGPGALDLLQGVTSNDVSRLAAGQAQYSALTSPQGTVVDDLLVYRLSEDRFMLVVNAANIEKDFAWITAHNRFDANLVDISDKMTLLALQGPRALEILQPMVSSPSGPLSGIPYYHFVNGKLLENANGAGIDAILSRTGYTGEDGIEVYVAAEYSEAVWNAILEAGRPLGLIPAGLGARNTLRLEARMLLYGNDMDETTTLLEAGLGWIVKPDKGDFIGRGALVEEKREGPRRSLVGFEMLGREIARDHYPVFVAGEKAGHVTSGAPSLTLKKNIGLAYVPTKDRAIGTVFQVSIRGRDCDAQVVSTPFYKRR